MFPFSIPKGLKKVGNYIYLDPTFLTVFQISCRGNSSSNLFVGFGGSDGLERYELIVAFPFLSKVLGLMPLIVYLCSVLLTKGMQRLYFLVERCYNLREPVLLVGETGGGKTTVCQLLSACLQLNLRTLNCHQYTETSDFIGVGFLMTFLLIILVRTSNRYTYTTNIS